MVSEIYSAGVKSLLREVTAVVMMMRLSQPAPPKELKNSSFSDEDLDAYFHQYLFLRNESLFNNILEDNEYSVLEMCESTIAAEEWERRVEMVQKRNQAVNFENCFNPIFNKITPLYFNFTDSEKEFIILTATKLTRSLDIPQTDINKLLLALNSVFNIREDRLKEIINFA